MHLALQDDPPDWSEASIRPIVLQGTYRILERLGTGGMGEVYLAAHERFPARFAVKALHHDLMGDEEARARFQREGEILASLRHPNIVQVIDAAITADGTPYLVMELVDGKELSQHEAGRGSPLSPARTANVVHQIASALQLAHDCGVVHRDLKPENVMLLSLPGYQDFVKVIDFGISATPRLRPITSESACLGTPQFMAPEQALGDAERIDHRTDQFALACIAYTLLAGREPFQGDTALAVLYHVVHANPEPLGAQMGWRWREVDAVLRRGMAKDPDDRFPSILQFAEELAGAIERAAIEGTDTTRERAGPRRRPLLRAAMALAGVVGAAASLAALIATLPH